MKTVTICTTQDQVRARLSEHFAEADFRVDEVATEDELRMLLRQEARDALIIESRRESFSNIMRFCFQTNPGMRVHFFWDNGIFCFYPASNQPAKLVDTLLGSGLRVPPNLMKYAKPTTQSDNAMVMI
jgi:hypothetical protein